MEINFNNLDIEQCKLFADSKKYFELFNKYITGEYDKCLFYMIGNIETIANIMRKNEKATYYIYDNGLVVDCLKAGMPDWKKFHVMQADSRKTTNEQLWNGMKKMKFDKIIMNPPYSKNLHLKVLAEAIGHLTDDGECVNLSPIRWLQEPYRNFKNKNIDYFKFESSISKHISNLELMNRDACNNVFGIALYCNLGIYSLNKKINDYNYQDIWKAFLNNEEVSIFNKISNFGHSLDDVIEKNKKDGIRVMIAAIAGNRGALPIYKDIDFIVDGKKNGIDWTKCKNNGGYEKEEGTAPAQTIKFNSEYSAKNFYNSCKTTFYKFIANRYLLDQHIPLFWLPWLGDAINPRTGKKGYESEWTNEDFYKFFNITEDEQHLIEETMKKYK